MSEEEEERENIITEKQVKKATHLIHKLATRRGADFEDIQKKCKQRLGYSNLAKVTKEEGHAIIDKLIEWTGGEEEKTEENADQKDDLSPQLPTKLDDRLPKDKEEPAEKEAEVTKIEDDFVTATMRESIRAAVDITMTEVVDKEVPVMGLGGFVLDVGKVLFVAKMKASENDE